MKYVLPLIASLLFLAGCEERYRYPCQDPTNWDQQLCKKPFCSANGTCPEDLTHYEKKNVGAPQVTPTDNNTKGTCK